MTPPAPFVYPSAPLERRHAPRGYKDYQSYKPFLRDEFVFRCVYCLARERFYPTGPDSFSVDHFTPVSVDPARETDYENLVYCCLRCNSFKQAGITIPNPMQLAFSEHLEVRSDGYVVSQTVEGSVLIKLLGLNTRPALDTRRHVLAMIALMAKYPEDGDIRARVLHYLAYPDDLPDLSDLRPPDGNAKKESGVKTSHFERRKRGELPEMY